MYTHKSINLSRAGAGEVQRNTVHGRGTEERQESLPAHLQLTAEGLNWHWSSILQE